VNDPDPAATTTQYPTWYDFNGYDFGLSATQAVRSYDQGPIAVLDSADGKVDGIYTIYLHSYDFGGRTRLSATHPADTNIKDVIWVPKGSGSNGIGSAWQYDSSDVRLSANGDTDAVVFDKKVSSAAPLGDGFSNFEEYRGILYTEGIKGEQQHMRLNPNRKDLFVRAIGFDAEYPFAIGDALKNAGIDVHDITGWGHDATEDSSFYTYYRTGTVSAFGPIKVTGTGTSWVQGWPGFEWDFRLEEEGQDNPWIPIEAFGGAETLYLHDQQQEKVGGPWPYTIRMTMPHINVLTVRLDRKMVGAFATEDGYITFLDAKAPSAQNPTGSRRWAWTTKGLSHTASREDIYGMASALKIPLDHYFGDRPYQKGTVWEGGNWRSPDMTAGSLDMKLSPLSKCEDPKDMGVFIDGFMDEAAGALLGNSPNGWWDGDRRIMIRDDWETMGHLNPFDIDNDGNVELPPADDPDDDNYDKQHDDQERPYTKARVLQHTITHEIIHVLARSSKHTANEACVMNETSLNWKRDDYLSDEYRPLLSIHNKKR